MSVKPGQAQAYRAVLGLYGTPRAYRWSRSRVGTVKRQRNSAPFSGDRIHFLTPVPIERIRTVVQLRIQFRLSSVRNGSPLAPFPVELSLRAPTPVGPRVDIGSGETSPSGYLSSDIALTGSTSLCLDANAGLPFRDGSLSELRMSHTLEHLEDTVRITNDCWRVLCVGGILRVIVPNARHHTAFQDPTHRHFFTRRSFHYLDMGSSKYLEHGQYYGFRPWRLTILRSTRYEVGALLEKVEPPPV
jgi:hypothetical protein